MSERVRMVLLCLVLIVLSGAVSWLAMGSSGSKPRARSQPVIHRPLSGRPGTAKAADLPTGCRSHAIEVQSSAALEAADLPKAAFYAPGTSPDTAQLVHGLVHNMVVVKYRPDTAVIQRVRPWAAELVGDGMTAVVSGGERMPWQVAAARYDMQVACERADAASLRAIAAFAAGR